MPNCDNKLNLQQNTLCSVTNFTQTLKIFTPSRIVWIVTFSKSEYSTIQCNTVFRGPNDDGKTVDGPGKLASRAFQNVRDKHTHLFILLVLILSFCKDNICRYCMHLLNRHWVALKGLWNTTMPKLIELESWNFLQIDTLY